MPTWLSLAEPLRPAGPGAISRGELEAALKRLGYGLDGSQLDHLFLTLDADGSGVIERCVSNGPRGGTCACVWGRKLSHPDRLCRDQFVWAIERYDETEY